MSDKKGKHGALNAKLGYKPLFNTVLWSKLSSSKKDAARYTSYDVEGASIQYDILPPYPKYFNPRSPSRIPEQEYPKWFFTDADDNVNSIIALPLDQGKCGSCWAFASSSMFTDTLRHMLMITFSDKACFYSRLFDPLKTCTGDTGVENLVQGVTNINGVGTTKCKRDGDCPIGSVCLKNNTCLELFGIEVRDRISAYFTVGFAPKFRDSCNTDESFKKCSDDCSVLYEEWKKALSSSYTLKITSDNIGPAGKDCSGCEGNAIVMPLYLFVDKGAPLLSQFPVQEWGCIYGNKDMRKTFCTEEFLISGPQRELPNMIKADRYGHFTADDIKDSRPNGIQTMEEWIQAELFNNSSVTIGYLVYPSFFKFFQNNPKGIYTFKYFQNEIRTGNETVEGGHAVDIIGWDEDEVDGEIVRYWVVRNSWGEDWGDQGFFRFERGLDAKLREAGLEKYVTHFEDEFGTIYYAPFPNPSLYNESNYTTVMVGDREVKISKLLKNVVKLPPGEQCLTLKDRERESVRLLQDCVCEPGYIKNASGICVRDLSLSYNSTKYGTKTGNMTWIWIIVLAVVIVVLLFVAIKFLRKRH